MSGLDPDAVEAEIAAFYELEGDERTTRPIEPQRIETRTAFLSLLEPRAPVRLLEIGSGPGRDAVALRDAGHDVVAVDLSMEHARRCRATGVDVVNASARYLPFADGAFGAVWSMSTLMHVPNSAIDRVLGEVRRVLRPQGVATIGVWGGPGVEEYSEMDLAAGRPRRLFSRRTVAAWEEQLSTIGTVESSDRWGDDPEFFYHLVVVRRP